MKKFIYSILLLLGHSFYCVAQQAFIASKPEEAGFSTERLARIDQQYAEHLKANHFPGAVVFISRNGKVVLHKAYGYSDVESKTPLKKDDIFRMASQSKAITSLAVMILWEEGKFQLDDPVSKYIPEYKKQKVMVRFNMIDSSYTTEPAKSEITIRQLLTHTSGLGYAGIGSQEFKAIYAKGGIVSGIGNTESTIGEKMKKLGSLPLAHHPGERYTYGLNCDLLGYLVEVISGKSLDEFLRTRIFVPLGMKDTYFYLPKEKQSRLVTLYEGKENGITRVERKIFDNVNPEYPKAAGTYFSGGAGLNGTIEDYAKFLQLFLNGGTFNGVRLISRKTVELMLTNQISDLQTDPVGLGFGLETTQNDFKQPSSIGTFVGGGAFNTNYWADPKEKLVALFYSNMYGAPYGTMSFRILVYQAITD